MQVVVHGETVERVATLEAPEESTSVELLVTANLDVETMSMRLSIRAAREIEAKNSLNRHKVMAMKPCLMAIAVDRVELERLERQTGPYQSSLTLMLVLE